MWPDTRPDGTGRSDQLLVGSPWHRSWDTTAEHQRAAAVHRSQAESMYAEYEEACGQRTATEVSTSPIVQYGIGGSPTADGVVVYLSTKAGPPERLMAELKCHRAWMQLAPENMEGCPLDISGLQIEATGGPDAITLTLTVKDRSLIPELQKRVARDLELGNHR